jgi:hypothetical protein
MSSSSGPLGVVAQAKKKEKRTKNKGKMRGFFMAGFAPLAVAVFVLGLLHL